MSNWYGGGGGGVGEGEVAERSYGAEEDAEEVVAVAELALLGRV